MKPTDVSLWLSRIQKCEDLQSKKHQEWKTAIKLLQGTFFGNPYANNELTEVNFVYEFMEILVGSIYARNPHIFVRSYSGRWAAFAETMETVINYYWREKKCKKKMIKAIIRGALTPPGCIEVGYTLLSEKNKIIKEMENEFPELKEVNNKKDKVEEEQGILDETVREDDVFVKFHPTWNVLWPDGYHDPSEAPYRIIKEVVSYLDLKNNPSYKDVKYKLRGNMQSQSNSKPTKFTMKANIITGNNQFSSDEEDIKITLYHVQDKRSQKRFTLAKNFREDSLFESDWDYLVDGFTIKDLVFNEIPETDEDANSYPMSDITPMIPQLKELSRLSSAMNKHRKRAGTLLLAKKNLITETDATKIQNASDVDLIMVDDISEANIRGFTPPALPQDFYALREILLQDLMRISGFNQLLGNSKGIDTATESDNIRIGSQIRQTKKQDAVEDFTVDIAKALSGLIWQFIQDKKRIGEIIGEEVTEKMWPTLPKDMKEARRLIQRELHFKIDAGSTRPPKDDALERKQWADLTGLLKANYPNRIKDDLYIKQLLKKFDAHDIEQLVIGFDDEEVAAAQEENKLLLQGMKQVVTPNENDMLHLQVHSQVYQTPGLKITPEMDEHVMKHNQNMQMKNPKINPQRGDSKTSAQTTTPDLARQGVPEFQDIMGGIKKSSGMGGNRGGGITR